LEGEAFFTSQIKAKPGPDKAFSKGRIFPGAAAKASAASRSADRGSVSFARATRTLVRAAISVLTEPEYFLGTDAYLKEIAAAVSLPALRKDFIIDEYQIFEAKTLGAAAALLICALLDAGTLAAFIKIAGLLNLSALVEVHNAEEINRAVDAGARIIGINNRDLKTFTVDTGLSARLRPQIPAGIIAVSESGIKTPEDIAALAGHHFHGALIGESLMRAADKKQYLAALRGGVSHD
jgi:indole-3-glycerol phosphate synthase